jgi:SAM-dependent methyltransferase
VNTAALDGYVDAVDSTGICGWAADRADPRRRLIVEVRVNGNVVATARADGFRPDLHAAGIGDGRASFWCDVSSHLLDDENEVEVRFAASDRMVPNSAAPVSYAAMWLGARTCQQVINRRISGDESRGWLEHAMDRYLAPALGRAPSTRPREDYRCLLLGANEGYMERALCAAGFRGSITASDIADKALARASAAAIDAGYSNIEHVVADLNRDRFDGPYDWIIAEGVLHHVERIDACLDGLAGALAPDGCLIMVEYVGPRRFQLSDLQTRWIRAALDLMPRELRPLARDGDGRYPATPEECQAILYSPPSEASIVAFDPSEAIIGPRLLTAVEATFDIVERTGFGGTLLSYMTGHFDFARANDDPFADAWLRVLMQIEDTLIRQRVLDDEFVYLVGRPRGRTSQQ